MSKCQICNKGVSFGIKVSHSHKRSNKKWKANIKRIKTVINNTPQHIYICTRCMRTRKTSVNA